MDVELVEHGMFISPQFQHGFYMESAALDNSHFIYSYRCCQHDGVNQSAWTFQTARKLSRSITFMSMSTRYEWRGGCVGAQKFVDAVLEFCKTSDLKPGAAWRTATGRSGEWTKYRHKVSMPPRACATSK